jgi:lysophospholipase L1-like esterase
MKITEKLKNSNKNQDEVRIAFLGDSVTQGCFEIYKNRNGNIAVIFDEEHSYPRYVNNILKTLYPDASLKIINAGLSGNQAPKGLERVESDIISHKPDLTVVCYGLNDCKNHNAARYTEALKGIFTALKSSGSEIIFMTPNMMNTHTSPSVTDPDFIEIAEECAENQNGGFFDAYINAARELCKELSIPVCDCYAIWKNLYENGVNVTELLSNKINHPTREMNSIFAYELVKTMLKKEI